MVINAIYDYYNEQMTIPARRTYAKANLEAIRLLGLQIRLARKQHKLTEANLAERVGISRTTLSKIERGQSQCEIGLVFEAAIMAGVDLIAPAENMGTLRERITDKIALMPARVRKPRLVIDDNF